MDSKSKFVISCYWCQQPMDGDIAKWESIDNKLTCTKCWYNIQLSKLDTIPMDLEE